MYKKLIVGSVTLGLLFAASPAFAMPNFLVMDLTTPGTSRTLVLPLAADNADVISLGTAVDPGTGQVVEGYAIFHHRPGHDGGPGGGGPPGGGGGGGEKCYAFIARGAAWNSVEPWVVNPSNAGGALSDNFVFDSLSADIAGWEAAADGANVLGNGTTATTILVADTVAPDDVNEVYFADISTPNVIGVTIVWGIFNGPPFGRELLEWDMVFDDVDFDWSEDAEGSVTEMDFNNIAMHELGHAVGMGHPGDTCTEETMFGSATEGEIKKRDLNAGDIAGVADLY